MRRVLSLDCAHRSLAYCYVEILGTRISDIKIISANVIDVLLGKNMKQVAGCLRFRYLKRALDAINFQLPNNCIVLIEQQPGTKNFQSKKIEAALCMYFADYEVHLINAKSKNRINLMPGFTLEWRTAFGCWNT